MPKIPTRKAQSLPSTNVGAAPVSVGAANVAGGAIGQGLQQFGQGVSSAGRSGASIIKQHQDSKDNTAMTKLKQASTAADLELMTQLTLTLTRSRS
jgi:hypothetical protein